jgi:hypothetical protein
MASLGYRGRRYFKKKKRKNEMMLKNHSTIKIIVLLKIIVQNKVEECVNGTGLSMDLRF